MEMYAEQTENKAPRVLIVDDNPEIREIIHILLGGEGYELEAYAYPEDADDTELVFSSSNENVVTVDEDGYLEALKEGRVTITVKNPASGVKATCTVRVREE